MGNQEDGQKRSKGYQDDSGAGTPPSKHAAQRRGTRNRNGNDQSEPPSKESNDRWIMIWSAVVGVFTGLLFLSAVVSAIFTYHQWNEMKKSREATEEQIRAYVSFKQFLISPGVGKANELESWEFIAQLQNAGATRAKAVMVWDSIHYYTPDIPSNLDLSKPFNPIPQAKPIVMGPSELIQLVPIAVTRQQAQDTLDGKGFILLWGHLQYADPFDRNSFPHQEFCTLAIPFKTGGTQINWAFRPYQNACNTSEQ